jgi:hypothetical protein
MFYVIKIEDGSGGAVLKEAEIYFVWLNCPGGEKTIERKI